MLTTIFFLIAFIVGTCAGIAGLGAVLRLAVRKEGIQITSLHPSFFKLVRAITGQ